ncbi:MAG: zinc ribbon domain-containing protein [Desulfobulbaceae bacterium]|nr:zinc ribbon domain-containing protein [Desulfobulbaceae bacterium]
MPLFDFICHACGKEFEILLLGKDRPVCPHCQSKDLEKKMSAFARPRSGDGADSAGGGSRCGGCSGGSCATCH